MPITDINDLDLLTDIFRDSFLSVLDDAEHSNLREIDLLITELKKIAGLYRKLVSDIPHYQNTVIFFYSLIDYLEDCYVAQTSFEMAFAMNHVLGVE